MNRLILIFTVILFLLFSYNVFEAQELIIYTEEFPPLSYTENGKIIGVSTEVVEAVLKKTTYKYTIKSYPWARSYDNAQKEANALIYSISRRENRENLFKWIGIIVPSVNSVFTLKTRKDIKINSLEDLKKYRIGTTIEDARESYLVSKGFKLEKFDRVGGNTAYEQNYKKLQLGRFELWPMADAVAFYVVKKAGDNPLEVLTKVYEFTEISQGGYYIAAGLQTSDEIIKTITTELESFKTTEAYKRILKNWGM